MHDVYAPPSHMGGVSMWGTHSLEPHRRMIRAR
jgi:hypothetical protein